jgi:hypothetical protein
MKKNYALLLIVLIAIYSWLTLISPVDNETLTRYDITVVQLRLLLVTLLVPIVLIWTAAFYGFSKFKEYADYIQQRPDGKHLAKVALGLGVLAFGLALSSIITSVLAYFSYDHLDLVPTAVIIENYLNLAVAAVASYLIYRGGKGLATLVESKYQPVKKQWWLGLYGIFGVMYAYLALTSSVKDTVATHTERGLYYMPDILIATTIILPYLIAWYLALRGASLIAFYQKNTRGSIYKKALHKLSSGLSLIVASSILLQLATLLLSEHNKQLEETSLSAILLLLYVVIAVIAAGYIVIAQGAKKLKMIEEV